MGGEEGNLRIVLVRGVVGWRGGFGCLCRRGDLPLFLRGCFAFCEHGVDTLDNIGYLSFTRRVFVFRSPFALICV